MNTKPVICILISLASLLPLGAAETIYPTIPAGANPAVIPTPRSAWHATVQKKFDEFSGKHFDIVFDGDSITNRWRTTGRDEWAKRYANIAADFGSEGDVVENALWRLSKGQVDGIEPKVVVLMIGTNNVSGKNPPDQIADGIKALVNDYKKRCANAHIVLMGIFPRGRNAADAERQAVQAVNAKIARLADDKRVTFLDISAKLTNPDASISPQMMSDFLHPNAPGYTIWAEALEPVIKKYIQPAPTPVS